MKRFLIRVITASAFVAIVLAAIFGGLYSYGVLFLLIQSLSLWELHALTRNKTASPGTFGFSLVSGALIYLIFFLVSMMKVPLSMLAFVPVILIIAALPELWNRRGNPFRNFSIITGGLILICIPLGLLHVALITGSVLDKHLLLGIFILIWVYDSSAYIIGSLIGKTKLAERISPMKTVEGLVGGAAFCVVTAWILSIWLGVRPVMDWMVLAGCVVVFGTMGDLLESLIKRHAGVKDSGTLLPGHGGVLDRFDNFFFSVPFIAVYILLR